MILRLIYYNIKDVSVVLGLIVFHAAVVYAVYHMYYNSVAIQVLKRFEHPEPPSLIRAGEHFERQEEENEIKKKFFNK